MAVQPESEESVDAIKVVASYQRQLADLAEKFAIKEAIIETLREERVKMRELLDEMSAKIPKEDLEEASEGSVQVRPNPNSQKEKSK